MSVLAVEMGLLRPSLCFAHLSFTHGATPVVAAAWHTTAGGSMRPTLMLAHHSARRANAEDERNLERAPSKGLV